MVMSELHCTRCILGVSFLFLIVNVKLLTLNDFFTINFRAHFLHVLGLSSTRYMALEPELPLAVTLTLRDAADAM